MKSYIYAAIAAASADESLARMLLRQHTAVAQQADDTPITRVVNLLKEMQATIDSEQDEDEKLYRKLKCWCNNNAYEKGEAAEASKAKISELEATIESLTARSGELKTTLKELDQELAADKQALAEATATRKKQQEEFHGMELDSIQALENMKAALTVLGKHHESLVQTDSSSDGVALLALGRRASRKRDWSDDFEASHVDHDLDEYMRRNAVGAEKVQEPASQTGFLQQQDQGAARAGGGLSAAEQAIVKKAFKSVAAFAQAHGNQAYNPTYESQSGEIVGVLKQMQETMQADLAEAQKVEKERAAAFEELRAAKSDEIANGEKMSETKEDELATTDNDLAEAKEDLGQEQTALAEAEKFSANLEEQCAEADKNYDTRKQAREEESKAVSETIGILTEDEARDTFSDTYSFLQISATSKSRRRAAAALRKAALRTRDPQLSLLATTVELDAFTKVKKAIDDMIATLKTQQEDEVKKNDWCKESIQANEMDTAKTNDAKADLEAKEASLESEIKALAQGIEDAKAQIKQSTVDLQQANMNRKQENIDFQKTVHDQTVTIGVLKKALDRMANFYDKAMFLQHKQTPPVPQAEYSKNAGAGGVMQMIEKLIEEAKVMQADAKKAEGEAQAAYEDFIQETNDAIASLGQQVTTKTTNKAKATKEKDQTAADIVDTVNELAGLAEANADLHKECDYLMKNFDVRQKARQDETEALQQAKQILSGASLS